MRPRPGRFWLTLGLACCAVSAVWLALQAGDEGPPAGLPKPPASSVSSRDESPRPDPKLASRPPASPPAPAHSTEIEDPEDRESPPPLAGTEGSTARDAALLAEWLEEVDHRDRGLVVGRILSPGGAGDVRLEWNSPGASRGQRVELDDDGDTELIEPRAPGVWSLTLHCPSCDHEAVVAQDIRVEARRLTRPLDLNPLDLRRHLFRAEIQLVDGKGAPFPRADIEAGWARVGPDSDGSVRLLVCGAEHRLTVREFGYRTFEGSLRPGFQEIVMRRGPRVRLALAPDSGSPPGGITVGATLFRKGRSIGGVHALGNEWTGALLLSEPGTYRVVWSLRPAEAARPTFLEDSALASSTIEVRDVDEVQEFALLFSPARLNEALEELAELEDGR